ncbi:MAG: hypothetical protein PHO34_01335 [Candidatus Omnitrophica bacterium]|nr:hypothetical protein [Candidatus Omnitrophota bacterium]
MLLILDPFFPYLRWAAMENGKVSEGKCLFDAGWLDRLGRDIGGLERVRSVGYVLYHGGEIIKDGVEEVSPESIGRLERCVKLLPEYNDLTLKAVRQCRRVLPRARHLLLCDTAFFVDLPEEVSTYAVPYELRRRGIRRYGSQGLVHQWAWKKICARTKKKPVRAISIYLGNYTNVVAICGGKARETSTGFTQVEGIISASSCGDIDPTVIFQLHSTGMSFEAINRLLSKESGFAALAGKKTELADVLCGGNKGKAVALRRIYCYNILKYVGAFVAALGSVDTIMFIGEDIRGISPFIRLFCRSLDFLGLKAGSVTSGSGEIADLTHSASRVNVFYLKYNKWRVLSDWCKEVLK